ncbi:LAETG motif-containing sortase-dependent surface protein [Kitasatospora sp. NPDC058478]|uniref:LAETG motif-containing sortase-dependent surface protein n=1 Tax=unclassified Kitasatospora TaxID=2633591 RepID=UPI003662A321
MRSSRLLAASALMALSFGTTVGAVSASAVGVPSSPPPTSTTATPSAPAPSTPAPSTTPSAPAPTTSAPTTPAPTTPAPTGKPTNLPTPPMPTPSGGPCRGGLHQDLKVTGTGLAKTTLVKGGAAQEATVTFENTGPVDLKKVDADFFFTDVSEVEPVINPVTWGKESFTIQVKLPGGDWKTPAASSIKGDNMSYLQVDLGEYKLAKGQKITFQVRLAATDKAVTARYFAQLSGYSEQFEAKDVPGAPATDSCLRYDGSYRVDDLFKVTDASAATPTAGTPAAAGHGSASASPSAGPHLAETGADSSTLPIALGGAAVLAAGAGTVFVLRRRKAGAHS